jgi:glucokinase
MEQTMEQTVALGVDIGGTNTSFGLVTRDGVCLVEKQIPTQADRPAEELFRRLSEEATSLLHASPELRLMGIGVGAPNANYYRGTIENPPNLSWQFVDVRKELHRTFDVPLAVTNDANAAALGEMLFGAAKGMKNFLEVTLGTGLGSGFVANGALIYGANGFAGELGHMLIVPNGRLCGCGRRGCLETYVSATGLCRTMRKMLEQQSTPSELRSFSTETVTAKRIAAAAAHGDALALHAFDVMCHTFAVGLANAVAFSEPEAIILFGGLTNAGALLFEPTKRYLEENLFSIYRNTVRLLPTGLPEGSAAILGSAALIWNEIA